MKKLVIALPFVLLSTMALAQAKSPSAAVKDLQAQVTALETKVTALQAEVYTLRGRLDELSARKVADANEAPPRDATAALKATISIVNAGGSYAAFKEAYLAAQVKVDTLPEPPADHGLRQLAAHISDADSLWVLSARGGRFSPASWANLEKGFPGITAFATGPGTGTPRPRSEEMRGVRFILDFVEEKLSPSPAPKE